MKAVYGHTVCIVCSMSIFSGILSGCTIGGKSFSIDSNSRVPFFGLELKERKPKSTAPSYQSISQTNRDSSEVKIALQVGSGSSVSGLKKRDNRLVATSLSDRIPLYSTPAKGVATTAGDMQTPSIPLPRTDLEHLHLDQRTSSSGVDFQ
ncbi:MAG: hypothetical protein WCH39_01965 [Schlesneria sp.]